MAKTAQNLDRFDPLTDALAFGERETEVAVTGDVSGFEVNGQSFGPFKAEEKVRLPEYAAIYLMLKDKARSCF